MSVVTLKPDDLVKLVVARTGLPKLLVDVDDAAEVLSLSRSTVYDLMAAGRLPSVYVGRSRRIPWAALEAFVAALPPTDGQPLDNGDA